MTDTAELPPPAPARQAWFLNAAFDRLSVDDAFAELAAARAGQPFRFVTTPNVDHLVRLSRDPELARLYALAALSICDSRVLELMARLSGEEIAAAPGADLVERLFELTVDPGQPITIVGGDAARIEALAARYGLTDVRWHAPPMNLRTNPKAVAEAAAFVAANPSRYVFLCVGSPQQEMIAEACLQRGDCAGLGLCVGAALDFLTGAADRAPAWLRRARLEWLHRLASEPRRLWRRYLVDAPRVFAMWRAWRRDKRRIERLATALRARAPSPARG